MPEYLDKEGLQYALTKLKTNLSVISSSPTKDIIKFTKTASISAKGSNYYTFVPFAEFTADLTCAFALSFRVNLMITTEATTKRTSEASPVTTTSSSYLISTFFTIYWLPDSQQYNIYSQTTTNSTLTDNTAMITVLGNRSIQLLRNDTSLVVGWMLTDTEYNTCYSYTCNKTLYVTTEIVKNAIDQNFSVSIPTGFELFDSYDKYKASKYNTSLVTCHISQAETVTASNFNSTYITRYMSFNE